LLVFDDWRDYFNNPQEGQMFQFHEQMSLSHWFPPEFVLACVVILIINAVQAYMKYVKRQKGLSRKEERSSARFYTSHDTTDKPCQFYTGDDDENDNDDNDEKTMRSHYPGDSLFLKHNRRSPYSGLRNGFK
jgi:hypothetical protein